MRWVFTVCILLAAGCGGVDEVFRFSLSIPEGKETKRIEMELLAASTTQTRGNHAGTLRVERETHDMVRVATSRLLVDGTVKYKLNQPGLGLIAFSKPSGAEQWFPYFFLRALDDGGGMRRVQSMVFSEVGLQRGNAELVALLPGNAVFSGEDRTVSFFEPLDLPLDYQLFVVPVSNWGRLEGMVQSYVVYDEQP